MLVNSDPLCSFLQLPSQWISARLCLIQLLKMSARSHFFHTCGNQWKGKNRKICLIIYFLNSTVRVDVGHANTLVCCENRTYLARIQSPHSKRMVISSCLDVFIFFKRKYVSIRICVNTHTQTHTYARAHTTVNHKTLSSWVSFCFHVKLEGLLNVFSLNVRASPWEPREQESETPVAPLPHWPPEALIWSWPPLAGTSFPGALCLLQRVTCLLFACRLAQKCYCKLSE